MKIDFLIKYISVTQIIFQSFLLWGGTNLEHNNVPGQSKDNPFEKSKCVNWSLESINIIFYESATYT